MSTHLQAVQWNKQKVRYDAVLGLSVLLFLITFYTITKWRHPTATDEIVLMRGTSIAAYLLLHFILAIGPACRLQPLLLPWLYNRRHAGVTVALLASAHALLAVTTYHAGGDTPPWISLFTSERFHGTWSSIPFQPFGFAALVILALMAATSHDFWLHQLTPHLWKKLHMSVYLAYALITAHVCLGALQAESHPLLLLFTVAGALLLSTLHVLAGRQEKRRYLPHPPSTPAADRGHQAPMDAQGFIPVCSVHIIPDNRAHIVSVKGQKIAVFKHQNRISAVSNICRHQGGPLGEGQIRDGCITCPWHGYQYLPESGASPPPFHEKIATYHVQIINDVVHVHPTPNPPGTHTRAALIPPSNVNHSGTPLPSTAHER